MDVDCYFNDYFYVIESVGKDVIGCIIYNGNSVFVKFFVIYLKYWCVKYDCVIDEFYLRVKVFFLFV